MRDIWTLWRIDVMNELSDMDREADSRVGSSVDRLVPCESNQSRNTPVFDLSC